MQVQTLESLAKQGALAGKRVLIRSDLNAPRDEAGNITDETRLIASVPAIRLALDAGAAVMVMSHLGRPTEGECRPEDSLAGITVRMSELVGVPITLSRRYLEEGVQIKPGQVVMLENCRCNKGEKKNNEELAKAYAALCDVYVNDAFGTAHRAQASTEGVARFASVACAGPLMASEIEALTKAVAQAEHPLVAIVGGSKVSTKLTILNNLAQKVDQLIVGGGIANTFLLLLAGLVMVLTLWFSKKAQIVIQTSINLSSSNSGEHEQFGSSLPGRMIVRASMGFGRLVNQFIPMGVKKGIDSRFEPKKLLHGETPLPFDYVRASINLVVSAVLIASATSLKLPLSTTYVTLMVAMGSSFADGAWDRETAVYRISGVLTVISGWFITALCASTMAAVVCWLTLWGEGIAALIFAVGSVFLLVRSNLKAKLDTVDMRADLDTRYDAHKMQQLVEERTEVNFEKTVAVFGELGDKFLADKEADLRQIKTDSNELFDKMSADRGLYYRMANSSFKPTNKDFDARYCYYRISTNMREVGRSLQSLAKLATDHVANRHRIYQGELKNELQNLAQYLKQISTGEDGKLNLRNVMLHADEASNRIDALQAELLRRIPDDKLSVRGCELYLNFLVFAREFINRCSIVAVLSGQLDEIAQR